MKSLTADETVAKLRHELPHDNSLERLAELRHAIHDGAFEPTQPIVEVTFAVEKKDN